MFDSKEFSLDFDFKEEGDRKRRWKAQCPYIIEQWKMVWSI